MTKTNDTTLFTNNAIEASIRIGLIALLVVWCFTILEPFIMVVLWGLIVAIALYPAYSWLERRLGNRKNLAATLLTTVTILCILLTGGFIVDSLAGGVADARDSFKPEMLVVPPPPPGLAEVPIVGHSVSRMWNLASTNLEALLEEFAPQLQTIGVWLLEAASGAGIAFLIFIVSTIIAGVFLAKSDSGASAAREIGRRVVGARGDEFVADAESTIRNVTRGILGVAAIQALLAGIGFVVAGVPGAGLWAFLCLILAVIQIGIGPIAIPVAIYMFYAADTVTATLLAIWLGFALVIDNVLKPILLGRKAPVPMMVIFLGSIGGFLSSGIIGLFIGAVVLSLGYKLFLAWLRET